MNSLIQHLHTMNTAQDFVLILVQHTQGSTYRKPGAMMLISADEQQYGLISGGCLEADVLSHARQVFKEKQGKTITFDLRGEEDIIWGMGVGCDGLIELELIYLAQIQAHQSFFDALVRLQQGENLALGIHVQNHEHHLYWHSAKEAASPWIINNTHYAYPTEFTCIQAVDHQVWLMPYIAPIQLLICGAGPDVPPLLAIASTLGWQVTIVDHRESFLSKIILPPSCQQQLQTQEAFMQMDLSRFHAVVIMSHQFNRDGYYLAAALTTTMGYIGLLGPIARKQKLLEQLQHQDEPRLFGPIGLAIGADSPAEIALAIISEIQLQLKSLNKK